MMSEELLFVAIAAMLVVFVALVAMLAIAFAEYDAENLSEMT